MSTNEKKKAIGALWEKQLPDGRKLLSGEIEIDGKKTRIVLWSNTFKKPGERSPDVRIFVDTYEPKKQRPDDLPSDAEGSVPPFDSEPPF